MDNCFYNISMNEWKFQIPQKKSDQFNNIKNIFKDKKSYHKQHYATNHNAGKNKSHHK